MATIRPRFPQDRIVVNPDGSMMPAWSYFFRQLTDQLPRPGWISVSTQQNNLEINTNGRSKIDYRLDGTTYLDTTLHFPTLTNDITNIGLVTTLKSVGTPTSASFSKITTDYAGRVSAVTPVLTSDITNLVDSVYVNVTGDTMTGDLTVPNIAITGSITTVDSAQFDTSVTPGSVSPGQFKWNSTAETMDLGLPNSTTLQIGQEMYARVRNTTGSTITNGSVVGFVGATSDALLVGKYLANGTSPSLYILGVMTHDIANGAYGYATVFGNVHELNTSTFSLGDVLYASPTVAGAFTNVKPTAPNNVIPVAAVTNVGTSGSIFVRPSIEQDKRYGSFVKTTDQVPALANTAYAITLDSTTVSNGVTLGTPTSRIVFSTSGLYNVTISIQVTSNNTSQKAIWVFYRKNGVNVPNSSYLMTSNLNNGYLSMSRSDFFSMIENDYLEVCFASDSANITIDSVASTAFAPASPAMVVSITQVQQ